MQGSISNFFNRSHEHKTFQIIIIGLEGAGKTLILYKLKLGKTVVTIPTTEFNLERIFYKKSQFLIWDVAGINFSWNYYFGMCDAVIFVVDSSDMGTIEKVKAKLHSSSNDRRLRDVPFLILGNKNDLPTALGKLELIDKLDLYMIRGRNWYIQSTSAVAGDGIHEGLEWLSNACISRDN